MRLMQCTLSLLLLISIQATGQQYSAGACILLQQQIDRFAAQPQNSNYRYAKREYERSCLTPAVTPKPAVRDKRETVTTEVTPPAKRTTEVVNATTVTESLPAKTKAELAPVSVASSPEPKPDQAASETITVAAQPELVAAEAPVTEVTTTLGTDQTSVDAVAIPNNVAVLDDMAVSKDMPALNDAIILNDAMMLILSNIPLVAANIVAVLLVIFLLTSWFGLNLPGFKGVFAEYKLNRLLRWRLSGRYQHFRKLKLFTAKDERTDVDHLVLSPYGIFVIMVKSNRGRIFGSETQANWTRQYFGNKKQFMNPLHQNFKNIEAVKHLLHIQNSDTAQHVHSVVAFSRLSQFETEMPAQVTYVDVVSMYLKKFTEPCFTDEQLNRFGAVLKQASAER
ncbi:nuclease-related domain-containing protein [Rheinheimera baltica]|uniref:nuclease-related domain-containing protein n=1 Tax=Rheinheimera baltica TaxID=67576 RepID=UPI00273EC57C|nr:NERD domain-containing protein [Rheinheimera baltica]MDP5150621.1 NERD domain-containing protein [Rheinheimera baltica]